MDIFYNFLKFFHVISFVFMAVPLFNLIVVNERASLGVSFNYYADRYMENIIKNGAFRCYVFQASVFISGILLLLLGPLGLEAFWSNWVVFTKTILLFTLTGILSFVHFRLQSKIEFFLKDINENSKIPENLVAQLKPYRVLRKWLATLCLFLVIVSIILGLQVYTPFNPLLTVGLIVLAGLFAIKVNKSLILLGWI